MSEHERAGGGAVVAITTTGKLDPLVDRVLATLDGFSASALHSLAAAFSIAGPPLANLSNPLIVLSVEREQDVEPSWLAKLTMQSAIRHAAWDHDFRERLVDAEDELWRSVHAALAAVAEDREQHAHPSGIA